MPIEIKYLETGLPKDELIKNGQSIKGTYSLKDKIKVTDLPIDSVYGIGKNQLISSMNEKLSVDLFSSGKLTVGDSVTIKSPLSWAFGPSQFSIDVMNTYVLKNIASGKANFDIFTTYVYKPDYPEKLSASGNGSGNCVYDMEQRRIVSKNSSLRVVITVHATKGTTYTIKRVSETTSFETTEVK